MRQWIGAAVIIIGVAAGLGSAHRVLAQEASKAKKQAAIRQEAQTTLNKLYKAQPGAKAAIQKAAGYAAFDNFGMNLFLLSTARGKGMTTVGSRVYRPEELATRTAFAAMPEESWRWYLWRRAACR